MLKYCVTSVSKGSPSNRSRITTFGLKSTGVLLMINSRASTEKMIPTSPSIRLMMSRVVTVTLSALRNNVLSFSVSLA